jgi:hypothetical protein
VLFRPDLHQQHIETGMQQVFEVTAKHIQVVVFIVHLHYKYKLISCKIKVMLSKRPFLVSILLCCI